MKTTKGITAGLLAGVLWGMLFVIPLLLNKFTPLQITFGRFFVFGLISLLNFSGIKRLFQIISVKEFFKIILLSASGFWLYTLVLFAGIQQTNGVISSLIIGILPFTLVLFGRPKCNFYLLSGLCLILMGIFSLLVLPLFLTIDINALFDVRITGVSMLIVALIMWTWFGINNSYFMAKHQEINSMDYSSLMGVLSFIFMLPVFVYLNGFADLLHHVDLGKFVIWSIVLGLGTSWLASIFWTYSAKNSPTSIVGSLIISETIFGLIYSFIFEQRYPYVNEIMAILFLIAGVFTVIYSQRSSAIKH